MKTKLVKEAFPTQQEVSRETFVRKRGDSPDGFPPKVTAVCECGREGGEHRRGRQERFQETARFRYNYRNFVYVSARLLLAWVLGQHMCKQQ